MTQQKSEVRFSRLREYHEYKMRKSEQPSKTPTTMIRQYQISEAALEYCFQDKNSKCTNELAAFLAFSNGAQWADENPKSPWISVEDKLPDDGVIVIVAYRVRLGEILYGSDVFHIDYGWESSCFDKVVAWMPIPELPKKRNR